MSKSYSSIKAGWYNSDYESVGKRKNYRDIKASDYDFGVDKEYVDNFIKTSQDYFKNAESESSTVNWGNATTLSKSMSSKWRSIQDQADNIRAYYNANQSKIDESSYNDMMSYLDSIHNNSKSVLDFYRKKSDYFGRYETEEDYKRDAILGAYRDKFKDSSYEDIINASEKLRTEYGTENGADWLRNYAIEKEYASSGDYDAIYSYASDKIDELLPERDKITLEMSTYDPELYADRESRLEQLNKDIEYYQKAIDFAKSGKNLKKREETYKTDMLVLGSNRFAIEELDPNAEKIVTNREFGNPTRDDLIAYDNRRDSTTWYTDANGNYYNVYGEPIGDIDEYNSKYADNGVEDKLGLYLQAHEQGVDTEAVGNNDTWSSIVAEGVANRWDLLTDDEKKVYYYYLNTSGKERADRFLDSMSYQLGKRENEDLKENIEDASALELILYNVASVPANVFGGIAGFVDDAINTIEGKDINPYSSAHRAVNYASAVRGETSEDIQDGIGGGWGTFFANTYQAVMSGADSLLGAATLGSGYTVTMGMGAATQKASELYERGASRSQIALGALASGAIEYITEKFSYDFIVNKLKNNAESRWGLIKAVLASAGNEGIEEVNSDILNMISESIIQGYNSADEVKVRELIDSGLTEDAARKRVAAENAVNIFWSFYGGAISGGLMSTGVAALGLAENTAETREKNRQTGSTLSETNNVDALMADVEGLDDSKENARAKALAKKIAETDTEKLSKRQTDAYNRKVGELYTEATKNRIQQVYGSDKTAIRSAIRAELENRGVKKIDKATEVILKSYFDKLSPSESILYDKINGKEVLTAALNKNKGEVFRASDRIASENMRSVSKLASLTTKAKGEVSTSGMTEQISTGKEVKIAKIESIMDGKMTFRLEDGSVVDSSDIRYANNDLALVYEGVLSMGVNADSANAIVSAYSAAPSIGAIPYIMGAQEAYNYGAVGYKQRYINSNGFYADLTDGQKELIYGLGASDAEADVSVKQKAIDEAKKSNTVKKGKITLPVEYSSLTDIQKASVSAVGRIVTGITHNEVEFYESVEKNGERVFASDVAGYKAGDTAPNGWYDTERGKIYLDLNSGNHGEGTIMWTAAHELTHFIRQWSPAKFKILADFLMAEYGKKGVDIETLILRQQEKARKRGRELDHDAAYEEVVADSMSEMFTDSRANISKKLFTLKQTDAGLVRKIKEFLNKMFESIQKLYNKLDAQTPEARYVRSMGDSIGKLSDLFADALKDAGETFQQTDNAKANNSQSNILLSDRNQGYEEYKKPINTNDIELLREITKAHNGARVSINDFTSEDIQKAKKWAYKFYKELGTKSPFFRAWFGDWRASDVTKTNVVSIPTIDISEATLTKGNYFINDTGWTVYAGKKLNDDTRHHSGGNRINVKSLNAINAILNNAILLDTVVSETNTNKKSANTAFLHKLYTPITYDGKPYIAVSTVEEYYNETINGPDRRAYNLKVIKIEPVGGQLGNDSSSSVPVTDSKVSISDLYSLVKTYDKDFHAGKEVKPLLLNRDGSPKVLYHQTDGEFTVFDVGRYGAGTRDNETPFGIFLKSSEKDIGLRGKKQIPLYARMDNPLLVINREQLMSKLKEMSPTYSMLWDKSKAIDRSYSDKSKQAQKEFTDYIIRNSQSENKKTREEMYNDPEFNRLFDAEEKVSDEWTEKAKENDILMKKEIEKTLRDNGHDGVILSQDVGSFGRVTDAFIVLDNTQVKSATDNIGTFDGNNPDFLYSLREVEPIKPTTNKWSRSLTTGEVKAMFPNLWDVSADESETRNPTQVKVTIKSYRKIYDYLKSKGFDGTILDASSGLGYGTKAGIEEYGFDVEVIEPYPSKDYSPKYTDYSSLSKTYDVIISNAVLNVLPQDQRDALVAKMGEMLNPGGTMFINVRGDDVLNASSKEIIDRDNLEVYISNTGSYQKGFTKTELKAYLEDALGDGYTVELTTMFGKVSAIVTKEASAVNNAEKSGIKYSGREDITEWDIDWDSDENSSIKSQIRAHLEMLNKTPIVSSITYDGKTPYYELLDKILKNFGYKISTQKYGDFLFDSKAVSNLRRYVTNDAEAAAIITAPYVIKRGRVISGHKNHKGKGYPSVTFAGRVSINGNEGVVGVCVLFGDKNRVHSLRILAPDGKEFELIKNDAETAKGSSTKNGVDMPTETASEDIINQEGIKSQPLFEKNKELLSERDIDATDSRSLLSNALKTVAANDIERSKLEEYQSKVASINAEQKKLTDLRAEIKRLSFATGKRDTKKITALRDEAIKTANRIGIYDKQLLRLEAAKPLQDLLEREKEKAYKRAMNKYKEARKKDIERRTKTVLRHHIAKIADDFRKRLKNPTEYRYVPRGLIEGIVDVCNEIDPTGKNQETITAYRFRKGKDALRELKAQYESLRDLNSYEFSSEYSEEFASHIEELAEAVDETPLRDMDIDQLEDVYNIINDIAFMLDAATKQIGTDERISNYQAGQEIIRLMESVKELGYSDNAVGNLMRNWTENPMRAVREMSAYRYESRLVKLFDALNEGRRKADLFRMEATKEFDKLRSTKEGRKNFDDAVEKEFDCGLTDIEGNPLKITKMQAMQLIMSYNRQMANEGQTHLDSGALIPDFELLKEGKYKAALDNAQDIGLVDMRIVSQIMSKLSEWDKQYMAVAEKFFDVTAKNAINETTMITKHRMIATDKRYIPYEVNEDEVAHDNENIKFDATIEGWGSLKSTKKNASQRLIIRGLNSIISDHIDKTAKVYGLAIPVRNFNKVINMKQTAGDGGKALRTAIRDTWHNGGLELIEQAVADLQGNRPGKNNKLFSNVKSAFVVSTLAGNFSVFIKQAASYPTAGAILSNKSLIKGLSDYATKIKDGVHAQDVWDEIDSHTSQHWIRRIGLSMKELGDLNQSKGWQNRINRKLGKVSPMNWIQAMDVGTTAALWYACKAEVEGKGVTEDMDNYWNEVTELYDKVIEETQPMYDSLHRAEITKDSKWKDVVMFATQPLQNSGILREGSMEYKLSKKQYGKDSTEAKAASKKFRKAVMSQAASHFVFTAMTLLADMIKHKMKPWKDDDEELTPESIVLEFAKEFGKNYFGAIVPIVGNYVISATEKIFGNGKYDILSDPTIDKINTTFDTFAKLSNPSVDNLTDALCEVASYLGIPAKNVKNIIAGTWLNIEDIVNGEAFSFKAGETTSQANSFVKICKTGNTSEIIDFYNKWVKDKMAEIKKQREKEGKVELSSNDLRSKAVSSIKSSVSSKFRTLYIDAYKNAKDKGIRDSEEMKNLRKQMLYSRLWDGSDEILETCKRWTDDYK